MKDHKTGMRYLTVTARGKGTYTIPLEIGSLAVGEDAWMRDIICKCQYCPKETTVGHNDQAGVCQECFDESCEENARLDGMQTH
jgi:hypothetical protein